MGLQVDGEEVQRCEHVMVHEVGDGISFGG